MYNLINKGDLVKVTENVLKYARKKFAQSGGIACREKYGSDHYRKLQLLGVKKGAQTKKQLTALKKGGCICDHKELVKSKRESGRYIHRPECRYH